MKEFRFTFLSEKDLPALHETFLKAFADYLVPIQLDWAQFQAKIKREGVNASFCAAAYVGEEMAGFILTGLGEWQGRPTAYNAGAGVVPQYRGHSLTRRLYAFMFPKLQESGLEQCLLEVIKGNAPAVKTYKQVGFEMTRTLESFRTPKEELLLRAGALPESIRIVPAAKPSWKLYRHFWDVTPTWQNHTAALVNSPDTKVTLEAHDQQHGLVGYLCFFPQNGAIAQFAVDKSKRSMGVGSALLQEAVRLTVAPWLMLINVDTAASELISFLQRRHFKAVISQYEMLLPLSA